MSYAEAQGDGRSQPTMSEDGIFFRHTAQGAPVSCNSRYATPQYLRKQKDWLRLSLFLAVFADLQFDFGAFWEARPLSGGLVSFSESGKPITTAHPYFLLFDTAKLDSPNAAYLRSRKKLSKFFSYDKRPLFWRPQKLLVNSQ